MGALTYWILLLIREDGQLLIFFVRLIALTEVKDNGSGRHLWDVPFTVTLRENNYTVRYGLTP